MGENNQNEPLLIDEQIKQMQQQLEELTFNHLYLITMIEQLQETLLQKMNQQTNNEQRKRIISSFDRNKEIAAFTKENRSFIQSIWKRKRHE